MSRTRGPPDLKPFFGGTYFPPNDKWGQPGLPKVLNKITEAWKADRDHIVASSDKILGQLQSAIEASSVCPDSFPARARARKQSDHKLRWQTSPTIQRANPYRAKH